MEGAMQKELSTQDLNGRPGRRWVPAGDGVRGAPQARSWLRPGMTSPGLKHSGADPTLQFAGSSGSGGLCSSNPFSCVWPYLRVHYHCQNWPLVSLQGWLEMRRPVCCCDGAGVLFFSKLPLMFVCPVLLSPSRLPSAALGPRPTSPQPPRPEFLESTFAIFVFALRRVFRFISCFIYKSCLWFCFVLFPSFSEKIVAAFLSLGFKKGVREVVWGRRVVRHTGKSEGCVLL